MERGETPEDALVRELREELGIYVNPKSLAPLQFASHAYTDVRKPFHLLMPLFACVDGWTGEPIGAEAQRLTWAKSSELEQFEYAPADVPLLPAVRALLHK